MSFLSMVSSRLAGGYYRRRFFANAVLRSPGCFGAGIGSGRAAGGSSFARIALRLFDARATRRSGRARSSLATGGRHQSECPADIVGIRKYATRRNENVLILVEFEEGNLADTFRREFGDIAAGSSTPLPGSK